MKSNQWKPKKNSLYWILKLSAKSNNSSILHFKGKCINQVHFESSEILELKLHVQCANRTKKVLYLDFKVDLNRFLYIK